MIYILSTVLLTVYCQVALKAQANSVASEMQAQSELGTVLALMSSPLVWSALIAAFGSFISWSIALTKLDLSYAYPFTSISYVIIYLLSGFIFGEAYTLYRTVGIILIVFGLLVFSQE